MYIVQQALISRRSFIRAALASGVCSGAVGRRVLAAPPPQILYNGITLGSPWPPRCKYPDEHPVRPPYLADPPAVIPIDVGRQLFVDDFLIEQTTLDADVASRRVSPGQSGARRRPRRGSAPTTARRDQRPT